MEAAGLLWAIAPDGAGAVIERGRLVATWQGDTPLVAAPMDDGAPFPETPPTVGDAEEAHLVWQWLNRPGTMLLDATAPLILPAQPVPSI
jgi:hypothetical protein